jgi:hypothetical protein
MTLHNITPPAPGTYGKAQDRKIAVARQLAQLLAAARRAWGNGKRPC